MDNRIRLEDATFNGLLTNRIEIDTRTVVSDRDDNIRTLAGKTQMNIAGFVLTGLAAHIGPFNTVGNGVTQHVL